MNFWREILISFCGLAALVLIVLGDVPAGVFFLAVCAALGITL